MKILVVCQYYDPEPFRINDICEELAKKGHNVFVLTGIPNYPLGEVYDGYQHGQKRDETINGVRVHRCFTLPRKNGALHRFLNYYSYACSSWIYANGLREEFDVVFINQLSPVMMAGAGIRYAKNHNKKSVLYCLDLWPESLVAGAVKENSLLYRCFLRISKRIYHNVDKIIITSRGFQTYFEETLSIHGKEYLYLPQYAEDVFEDVPVGVQEKSTFDLVFAGNIGEIQSVETILLAAQRLEHRPEIRFHIVGDGSDLERCRKLAATASNVVFYGHQDIRKMPQYYSMADAMIVTLKDSPTLSRTLPGKVQSYLAAGKPIIGAINGETASLISEAHCGLCCSAEDFEALSQNIQHMADHRAELQEIGANGKAFYRHNFNKPAFMEQLTKALT